MLRSKLARAATLTVLLAGIATGGALAAGNSINIGPSTALVNPNGYRFAINATCSPSADTTPCNGLLSITTVPIKPYSSIPKKTWVVGALPFSIPAGKTAPVRGRLLAGALVQAKLTGRVKVLVKIVLDGTIVGSKALTLKLNSR